MSIRTLFLLLLLAPALAWAESDLVKKESSHGVQATMDRLEALVKEKGLTVFDRIDHRANAESVGKKMPDAQLLIFGNPEVGTRIMRHDPAAGLDLPLRALVYADYDGTVWLAYHNPQGLKQTYSVEDCRAIDKVEGVLDLLSDKATQ